MHLRVHHVVPLAVVLGLLTAGRAYAQQAPPKNRDVTDFRGLAWGSSPEDALKKFPDLSDIGSEDAPKDRRLILAMEDEIGGHASSVMLFYIDKRLQKAVIAMSYEGTDDLNEKLAVLLDGVGSKYGSYTEGSYDASKPDTARFLWKRKSASVFMFPAAQFSRITTAYETPTWTKFVSDAEAKEKETKF